MIEQPNDPPCHDPDLHTPHPLRTDAQSITSWPGCMRGQTVPFQRRSGTNPIYRTPAHRNARAALIAAFRPGDPCCLCGHPMWTLPNGKTSNLHADHIPGTDQYRGLAHGTRCPTCGKRCNQSDGAKRGRARQDKRTTRLRW